MPRPFMTQSEVLAALEHGFMIEERGSIGGDGRTTYELRDPAKPTTNLPERVHGRVFNSLKKADTIVRAPGKRDWRDPVTWVHKDRAGALSEKRRVQLISSARELLEVLIERSTLQRLEHVVEELRRFQPSPKPGPRIPRVETPS